MHTCSSVATYFLFLLGFVYVTQADWLPFTQLSLNRDSITITNSGNLVFFAGGRSTYTFYGQVEVFNFSSKSWNYNPRLTVPRSSLASTTLNNKVYFAGGQTDSGVSNVVDIYDLASEEWTTAKLNVARMEIAAASVGDLILFAGGRGLSSNSFDVVDIYNAKVFLSSIFAILAHSYLYIEQLLDNNFSCKQKIWAGSCCSWIPGIFCWRVSN